MGLNPFKKAKVPGLNTGALTSIAGQTAQKQRDLIAQRSAGLTPINQQFEQKRQALSAQLEPGAEKQLDRLGQDISGVNKMEADRANVAGNLNRQQQFRAVPEVQKMIRNQLGGNRMMGSGAALSTLAQPTIQASQSASDFDMQRQADLLANQTRRAEGMATTGFSTRQKAMADRIGMDQSTMDALTSMGRTDLIDKFNSLSGVEEQYGADMLGIEQARQADEMARAKSGATGWGSTIGSLAGLGLGAFGGPMGMAIGSQLGGMAGGALSGENAPQMDPTLLFALAQRNKAAVKGNLGTPIGAGRTTYDLPRFQPAVMPR